MNTSNNSWSKLALAHERDRARQGGGDDDSLFGLARSLFAILWRWRLLIAASLILGLSAAWLLLQTIPPTYVARADVYFDFSRQSVVSDLPEDAVAPSEATLNTEMEILSSRTLMGLVVDEFDLVEDPEFNPWLRDSGEPVAELEMLPTEDHIRTTAVSILLGQVEVTLVPNSYVFFVVVETLEPEKSAQIANGIADLFIQERTRRRLNASEDAVDWLERRASDLRDRVREAENQVAQQRALASPGADSLLNSTAVKIASLRERVATLEVEGRRLEALAADLDAASPDTALTEETATALQEFSGSLPRELNEAIAADDTERAASLMVATRDQIAGEVMEAQRELRRARSEVEGLLDVYSDQTAEVQALRDSEREAAASLAAYEAMLERVKSQVAAGAIDPFWPEATVISSAVPPAVPSSPQEDLILALGGIGSLMLASAAALLLNALFPVVSSARELEQVTGLPVLAQLPLSPRSRLPKLQQKLKTSGLSPLAERLRALKIAIGLELRDSAPCVLVLTSAAGGKDKNVVGYLLAQSFLQSGQRVLVIDADPVSKPFGRKPGPDLGSVLLGQVELATCLQRDGRSGLDVATTTAPMRDEAGLLAQDRESRGFEEIASAYDVVVVIAPPIGVSSDAQVLARMADAALVVVRRNVSRPALVADALDLLVSAGASRVATVLIARRR